MALDPQRGKLYWSVPNNLNSYIQQADLNGQNAGFLTSWHGSSSAGTLNGTTTIRDIFVEPDSGMLYWSVKNQDAWSSAFLGQRNPATSRATLSISAPIPVGMTTIPWRLIHRDSHTSSRCQEGCKSVLFNSGMVSILQGDVRGLAFRVVKSDPITSPDLSVSKTAASSFFLPEDAITYKVAVQNFGAGLASGVVVTDALPSGVTLSTATTNRGDPCTLQAGNSVDCDLDEVAVGETIQITMNVQANPGVLGVVENRAGVQSAQVDLNALNDSTFNLVTGVTATATNTPTNTPTATHTPTNTPTPTHTPRRHIHRRRRRRVCP